MFGGHCCAVRATLDGKRQEVGPDKRAAVDKEPACSMASEGRPEWAAIRRAACLEPPSCAVAPLPR